MNSSPKQVVNRLLLAGVLAGLTGCILIKVDVNGRHDAECCQGGNHSGPGPGVAPNDPWPQPGTFTETFDPTGNDGFLIVPATSFANGNGGQTCFPTAQGWNKYFPLPRYLLGPGVTPNSLSYTNIEQLSSVTIKTCDSANGTTLETGIVIYEEFNPSTDKVCATNSAACLASGKLTINTRALQNGKRYRAMVFYKSPTLSPLTSVKFSWSYP